jgi:hypothetical protein
LVPIPEQQAALERIRELRVEGMSLRKISAELARDGHKLSHVSVGNILSQERCDGLTAALGSHHQT